MNIIRKIKLFLFGKCAVDGHNWKMKKGWKNYPLKDGEPIERLINNPVRPGVYYECKKCGAIAINEPKE
jgi:hypothetical protein